MKKKQSLNMDGSHLETIGKRLVRWIDSTVNFTVLTFFLLIFTYGCYAMWDSKQIYRNADSSAYQTYKPVSDDTFSFKELKSINPEVIGWISIYGTNIDYPLVQGKDNEKYINTDSKGKYSLSGSIFMDYRNNTRFADFNTIVFGHHMVKSAMFGDIENFKENEYFNSHKYGNLFFDGRSHGVELFAFLETDAYDQNIYSPGISGNERCMQYYDTLIRRAVHKRDVSITPDDHILLLSTCTSDITNGRHILAGKITGAVYPGDYKKDTQNILETIENTSFIEFLKKIPIWVWVLGIAVGLVLLCMTGVRSR